ncbi:four helix bundle protein [Robertkochia solimangrovi]|uniref:four helix bundle protein n=1 Tax=Robertkochia solimangrovi TaxID=2213046 RepID=UPI00118171C6|nr:four helix bundle protein [Robertkochia solimangrovi]TRZ44952.1 four helix bundle protein [Robertkochia solimangrovi]
MGVISDKSFQFALNVVDVFKQLNLEKKEFVMSKQLLRSGTAIGALYREAEYAETRLDFIHKLSIAQKECSESIYWIELLRLAELIDQKDYETLTTQSMNLMQLIKRSIITAKSNKSDKKEEK